MADGHRAARVGISLGVSLFFLYLTFCVPHVGSIFRGEEGLGRALFGHGRFDLAELWHAITIAQWGFIALVAVLYILGLLWRAWRWHLLMPSGCSLRYGQAFAALLVGYMANNLLPLRMGELYRAQVVWQLCGLSRSSALGTIVLERTLDLLFFLPFAAAAMVLFPFPSALKKAGLAGAAVILLFAAFLIWMVVQKQKALTVLKKALSVTPVALRDKLVALFDRFASGLSALRNLRLCVLLTVQSLGLWCLYALVTYLMLVAMRLTGPDMPMIASEPLAASLVLLVITTVGFVIPSAPGAVGTYHGITVLGLSLLAVPGDRAAGFAVLLHALNFLPLTGMGLFFFWQQRLSFRRPMEAPQNSGIPHFTR